MVRGRKKSEGSIYYPGIVTVCRDSKCSKLFITIKQLFMKKIAEFYLRTLLIDARFGSPKPNADQQLLLPEFKARLHSCIQQYKAIYPAQEVTFAETYRSNVLQQLHYRNGASKIKKNGMHHYGIAADSIFIINGRRSYKGDIVALRKIYAGNGLTLLGMWDALHVQFIPVAEQQLLRNTVAAAISKFQKDNGLAITGEANVVTIAKAKAVFGR
jgi:hypothetical protein